jgi:hypothetical protein
MFPLINNRSHEQSEAQAFFNESHPTPWPGMIAGLVAATSVASTLVMLFTV